MMDPLTGIALGVGALSSLSSMLGGARAMARARASRESAIRDYMRQSSLLLGEGEELGRAEVHRVAGQLSDALGISGRSLGSALAGAGVWNASSVAGALGLQSERNASVLGGLVRDLARDQVAQRRSALQTITGMRVDGASSDWSSGMSQRSEGLSGLGALAQVLGQSGLVSGRASVGGRAVSGDAKPGKSNNALDALLRIPLIGYRGYRG